MKAFLATALLLFCSHTPVETGADRLFEASYFRWIEGKRVGLITNPSGVDSRLVPTVDLLTKQSGVELVALFGPEHGLDGQAQAGESVSSNPAASSLYGKTRSLTPDMLQNVDVLLYDIQDVGARFYTYISTLFESMKTAAQTGIPLVVLDRPNPIDATRVEGPVLESGYESFVGIYPLPIRYGLTVGELAMLFNHEAHIGCDLRIVPIQGWKRSQWYEQTDLHWILPSPNMPRITTAAVYPGLGLIEGTNLSEGRGTTLPFELMGAPWFNSRKLTDQLNQMKLGGVHFRPQAFTPTFSKYKGELCRGIQVHILDRDLFQPLPVVLHILAKVLKSHPGKLQFKEKAFDRLAGNSWIREGLLRGQSVDEIVKRWQPSLEEFKQKREKYLLYR